MRLLFFVMLILVCNCTISCKKKQILLEKEFTQNDTIDNRSKTVLKFLKLSPEAEKNLKDFPEFQIFKATVDSLNMTNTEDIKILSEKLYLQSMELEELLPSELKIAPITARIKVLITETGLLQQRSNKKNMMVVSLDSANQKLEKAYNNLIVQFNEFYLEIPENIAKELLRDSKDLSDTIP